VGPWTGLIARDRNRLEAAKTDIENAVGRTLVCVADGANAGHIEAAAEQRARGGATTGTAASGAILAANLPKSLAGRGTYPISGWLGLRPRPKASLRIR
jgi:hypothetical protein